MKKVLSLSAILLSTLLISNAEAWVATGGHGGYHGGDVYHGAHYGTYNVHNGYYYNGWAAHGVVVGVPEGAYYGYGCAVVQSCNAKGCSNYTRCQ
jgi:hypothetical protein